MKKIDIFFIYNSNLFDSNPLIEINNKQISIKVNCYNLSNYNLTKQFNKINDLINIYDKIKRINIIFDVKINNLLVNNLLAKLNDVLYNYYNITKEIKLYQVNDESIYFMEELTKYKNIVMDPNKTPDSYLEFVKNNLPKNYKININTLTNNGIFPLTYAVGLGSNYNSYFVHIEPITINKNNKNIYLIGKAVTYDAGGLNIKTSTMEDMKVDMTGSAIILSVLRLLNFNNHDSNLNIHLLMPIVENMVSSKSLKPGSVIESMNGKKIEITNTDAEGRLCIIDCIDWINKKLINESNKSNSMIIDIATLTGNTQQITSGISSIIMSNDKGLKYADKLINIGENIGEYLDYLKIRNEYIDMLNTPVADIKNINLEKKAGCVIGGTFIYYFTNRGVPWIHIDLGVATFVNSKALSYGVNLLYEFMKELNKKTEKSINLF